LSVADCDTPPPSADTVSPAACAVLIRSSSPSCGVRHSKFINEDWDTEAKAQPEPTYTLPSSSPYQQHGQKQFFLRYAKTIHGRETAARVRAELNSLKITEENFAQWKQESLQRAIDKIDNPPENLLRRRY